MQLTIIDKTRVPNPGSWIYTQAETGRVFKVAAWQNLLAQIRQHRMANQLPIGAHFEEEIEATICANRPDLCEPAITPTQMVSNFFAAAWRWAKDGFSVVTEDVFQTRMSTCAGCEYWRGWKRYGFGRCGKCGCSGIKLFLPSEKCPIAKW